MLLTSTYSSNATVDIPLIIVSYAGRKRFMLKTNAYSAMISDIRQIFDIQVAHQLRIETVALDVCRGSSIEVGEDVWPVLMSILDEIRVVVASELDDEDSRKRALAQNRVKMNKNGRGRVLIENEERVKDEFVEKWLEQQNGEDEVPPPASVYSGIEYDVHRQAPPPHGYEPSEYEADHFHVFREEELLTCERSPRIRFHAQELERDEPLADEPQCPSSTIDERFQITVSGPDDQTAEIKTRGKHLVRKVLAAVCKTFDISYDRSSLHVVTHPQDGGEESMRMCPLDWSIARCGITSVTELRIQMQSHSISETMASLRHGT